jgi:hypothetical protein
VRIPLVDYPEGFLEITQNDLDRIARRMEQTGLAYDLTVLGRQFARGRLRYGPEEEAPLPRVIHPRVRVHVWDPRRAWHVGDYAVMAIPALRDQSQVYLPVMGEVIRIQGRSATVRVDGSKHAGIYGLVGWNHRDAALEGRQEAVEDAVAALRYRSDEVSQVDHLLWTRGGEIWGRLLSALRHDPRFVVLQGEWFLRSLLVMPSRQHLEELAHRVLHSTEEPRSAADLLALQPPDGGSGAAALFGLSLAMQAHSDLFTQIDPGATPRWVLAGPPPGPYTARQAAYDPETYTLLCEPGDLLSEEVVGRLWALGLLRAVL